MTYYDDIAEGYEELHKEEQEKKIALIKQHFSVSKENRLLDVGCGTGLTTVPWDCKRFGVDPAKKLIERAREKDFVEYKVAMAEELPYSDDSFDVVVSITAIQNFSDPLKAFEEMRRVCKGKFVLTFLKKSSKKEMLKTLIYEHFDVLLELEEDKDLIFIANYKR